MGLEMEFAEEWPVERKESAAEAGLRGTSPM